MKMIYGEQVRIEIIAIGISRDLTYRMRWVPEAEACEGNAPHPDVIYQGDAPVWGWIPKHPQDLEKLYPNTRDVPNKPGEYHWMTIFAASGFTRVDRIEEY